MFNFAKKVVDCKDCMFHCFLSMQKQFTAVKEWMLDQLKTEKRQGTRHFESYLPGFLDTVIGQITTLGNLFDLMTSALHFARPNMNEDRIRWITRKRDQWCLQKSQPENTVEEPPWSEGTVNTTTTNWNKWSSQLVETCKSHTQKLKQIIEFLVIQMIWHHWLQHFASITIFLNSPTFHSTHYISHKMEIHSQAHVSTQRERQFLLLSQGAIEHLECPDFNEPPPLVGEKAKDTLSFSSGNSPCPLLFLAIYSVHAGYLFCNLSHMKYSV